jgi:phosphohistidine phosphatase
MLAALPLAPTRFPGQAAKIGTMILYFLRHANAGQPKLDPKKDEKRPLDKQGIEQCHDVGRALAALDVKVDVIISSPLVRALQTAEIVGNEIRQKNKIITDTALRPEASYVSFQELLRRYDDKKALMIVGHNPSQTEFLNKLLAGSESFHAIELKKCGVAKVEKEGHAAATLKWLMPPKVIHAIQKGSASNSRPKTDSK